MHRALKSCVRKRYDSIHLAWQGVPFIVKSRAGGIKTGGSDEADAKEAKTAVNANLP